MAAEDFTSDEFNPVRSSPPNNEEISGCDLRCTKLFVAKQVRPGMFWSAENRLVHGVMNVFAWLTRWLYISLKYVENYWAGVSIRVKISLCY